MMQSVNGVKYLSVDPVVPFDPDRSADPVRSGAAPGIGATLMFVKEY
ncbi:MAG: hypothetical protein LBL04_09960 [Bacteroidales bacterium]|jgi:hypothetical protein|nr:hypothetical protein [Bacteroidales bacterium]